MFKQVDTFLHIVDTNGTWITPCQGGDPRACGGMGLEFVSVELPDPSLHEGIRSGGRIGFGAPPIVDGLVNVPGASSSGRYSDPPAL